MLAQNPNDPMLKEFSPPKPTMQQAIQDLIDLYKNDFAQEKFAEGVRDGTQ